MGDAIGLEYLIVARDVYHCHPEELKPHQVHHCRDFIALRRLEREAEERFIERARSAR